MRCTSCGHDNAADARFCSQCGTQLGLQCAVCSTLNEPGSRFCRQCGASLVGEPAAREQAPDADLARYIPEELLRRIRTAQAGGAMRGERRTVTMLFADIQGSTAAAEQLDPEDWADIINGAFAQLIAPVYRYEGTLARLQGDAILAFFGAPIAHEDDPVRAIRAGLEIVDAIDGYRAELEAARGVPVAVRVGINTGLVVVGEVGSDLRVEYTALGDAINIAARMEQTAAPGTVQITEHTANLATGMFDLTDIGPVEVKGKAEPVRAFRAEAERTAEASHRAAAPLVGREPELAAIEASLGRLVDGIGSICAVVGEAGIGKSRLVSVARANLETKSVVATRWDQDAADVGWLEGRSRSFDANMPYALFSDMLRRWWGVDAADATAWDVVGEAVERALGTRDDDTAAFLATVIGAVVPEDRAVLVSTLATPVLHHRTTQAIAQYLEAEATRRPIVLMLDDLHWGDPLSLALVERLMASGDEVALGLLLSLRPTRDGTSWRLVEIAGRDYDHRFTDVRLDALPERATLDLVTALLGEDDAAARLGASILERAGGNPLFIEELVRSLRDGGDDVPASLAGLLTARLDQLPEDARIVAQTAAVVGPEFEPAPLRTLLGGDDAQLQHLLTELVRSGIVVERRRFPTPLFAFRHVLIQETAYSTALLRTRRELHGRLAAYLEQSAPDAIQDIARHHLAAGARDRAFPFLVRAAQHATRTMALADAIKMFTTALDGVPADADPAVVVAAHKGLGDAYELIPDLPNAESVYQQLIDYARASQRPSYEALALNRLGLVSATHAGDFVRAEEYLSQAKRVAEECGDELGLAEYHMSACMVASLQGQLERAIEHDDETTRLGTEQGSDRIRLSGLFRRAINLLATTQYEDAVPAVEEAIAAAQALGDEESVVTLRTIGGADLALRVGDLRGALELYESGMAGMERFASFHAAPSQATAADVCLALGDLEGAIARASHARRFAQSLGHAFSDGVAAACLGHCYALCGVDEPLRELREVALASLTPPMGDFLASTTWAHLGWTNVARGLWDQAAEDFTFGLEVSSTTRFFERPRLLLGSVFVALARDETEAARAVIAEIRTYVQERAITLHDARLALADGMLATQTGDLQAAAEWLRLADSVAGLTGQRLVRRDAALARFDLALAADDADGAAAAAGEATALADQVASEMMDATLRASFLSRSEQLVLQRRPVTGR